ncbi:hypothetical protein N8I77_010781 [Diaporthe amygdali]|uniref:Uncharacterized protein n=1 Tax=Phomopsis amygdali TaxID=1214568 RepID=A0AAD9S7X4_PHOAM|nr:hypothetical protein N8I77_010781 [Diaporthe amygdali]
MLNEFETEICYGALFDAWAKPCGNWNLIRHAATQATDLFSTFSLTENAKGIFSMSFEHTQVAMLDVQMTSKLVVLRQISGVRCEAVVPNRTILKRKAKSSSPFQISVNIFGPREAADEVSEALAKVNAFLQHPQTLNVDVEYHNPDMLIFPGQKTAMNDLIGTSQLLLEESKLSRDVRGILESLGQVAEGDELGYLEGLVSTLTQHQQQGVHFVIQREDELFCRGLSAHISQITGVDSPTQADGILFGLGGLIADVMGIGKTLTILTSILHSANKAQDFSYFGHPVPESEMKHSLTKATLVVVPSVQLMENWESEILRHFSMHTLRHIRFHGPNRLQTVEALTAPDIVITTYATLAADHDSRGLLYRMEWYRVVLDEVSSLASCLENVAVSANGRELSTKLEAVVGRLVSASHSRNKAIVFSYWKTTLHILARLLRASGVVYLQVDGETSFVDRSNRLRAFKEESKAYVLLMTVETGAVGLNLTVANQVHIVEPQWNPSVEEQAVARAVRMGQKREVTIYRYVLQNTVEQNIVKLQERKRSLAKYTLGTKSDQSISDAVQELESVLELNPRKRGLDE